MRLQKNGYTVLELLIALSVTAIVAAAILASYATVFHGFASRTRQAERVRAMIAAKADIDRIMRDIKSVENPIASGFRYYTVRDSAYAISYRSQTVSDSRTGTVIPLKQFSCELTSDSLQNGSRLLHWEALVENNQDWIGGAVFVLARKKR